MVNPLSVAANSANARQTAAHNKETHMRSADDRPAGTLQRLPH
jgi:hypothetical protein